MRQDSAPFDALNRAPTKEPRYVVQLIYSTGSPSFTSHAGIANVPGVEVAGSFRGCSGTSQEIRPDEGRATIGAVRVDLTDFEATTSATDELRTQLRTNGEGIRDRELRVYVGYTDDFDDFRRVRTGRVTGVELLDGGYRIQAADVTRGLRTKAFERKRTNLVTSLSVGDSTVWVDSTADFQTVAHTDAFTDAPGQTVGYILLEDTGEVIRYTGKTANSFTGCTRARFGTTEKPLAVDAAVATDRKPEVLEFIYLELPVPALALALFTGEIPDTANTLPDHWHAGMSSSDLRLSDFQEIGRDLWDRSDEEGGLVVRFAGLEEVDLKAFVEHELCLFAGLFLPVYADGTLGLRRLSPILEDAPALVTLDASNIVRHGALNHAQARVLNQFRFDWNYDFLGERFTRTTFYTDAASVSKHGAAPVRTLEFKGLHGARHTEQIIRERVNALRDRYSNPPQLLDVEVLPSYNGLEVGDIVRIELDTVQDYAGTGTLARSFEVQQASVDWLTGRVRLRLFGSTGDVDPVSSTAGTALPDAWYSSEGTALAIPGNVIDSSITLTGGADLNAAGNIRYHDDDLEIAAGVTVTIVGNVQLRVRGFLTVNGKIDGAGWGQDGTSDTQIEGDAHGSTTFEGAPGFLGATRATDGVQRGHDGDRWHNVPGALTQGRHAAFPILNLRIESGPDKLLGLPDDLRGTSGGAGGQIRDKDSGTVREPGGAGGDSGSGLAIVCRGLGFGASGNIDLSGAPGSPGLLHTQYGHNWRPGTGAGGGPGALLVALDGDSVPLPDLSGGAFTAQTGDADPVGNNGKYEGISLRWGPTVPYPWTGYNDPALQTAGRDLSGVAARIQYLPAEELASEDSAPPPTAPSALLAQTVPAGIALAWNNGDDHITEIYSSSSNDRAFATKATEIAGDSWRHELTLEESLYYWIRHRRTLDGRVSDWYPASATAGIPGTAGAPGSGSPGAPGKNAIDAIVEYTQSDNSTVSEPGWRQDKNTGSWSPSHTVIHAHATFYEAGVEVARLARSFTLNTSAGTITGATVVHKAGTNLNTADVTVDKIGGATALLAYQLRYSKDGKTTTAQLVADAVRGGDSGDDGADGSPVNLVDPSEWLVGQTYSAPWGNWTKRNGTDALGRCVAVLGPYGEPIPAFEIKGDGATGTYALEIKRTLDADRAFPYVWACWVRFNGNHAGQVRFGIQPDKANNIDTGALDGDGLAVSLNPSAAEQDQWLLLYQYIYPASWGAVGGEGLSGLYDPRTGEILAASNELYWAGASVDSVQFRLGVYQDTDQFGASKNYQFARPMLFKVADGSVPSAQDLMRRQVPIQDGEVGTDQIAEGAVTENVSASASGVGNTLDASGHVSPGGQIRIVASITHSYTGSSAAVYSVFVERQINGGGYSIIQSYDEDSAQVLAEHTDGNTVHVLTFSDAVFDTPGAGTIDYRLSFAGPGATLTSSVRSLSTHEALR